MKHLTTILCITVLVQFGVNGYAQDRQALKPLLFAGFSTKINCTPAQLNSLFTATKGQNINLFLPNNFTLSGSVISNLLRYSNLQTIVIKLPAFKNTLFSLSRQTDQDNKHIYVGRILNPLYADGYELQHNGEGNYQLIKTDTEKILVNCSQ